MMIISILWNFNQTLTFDAITLKLWKPAYSQKSSYKVVRIVLVCRFFLQSIYTPETTENSRALFRLGYFSNNVYDRPFFKIRSQLLLVTFFLLLPEERWCGLPGISYNEVWRTFSFAIMKVKYFCGKCFSFLYHVHWYVSVCVCVYACGVFLSLCVLYTMLRRLT